MSVLPSMKMEETKLQLSDTLFKSITWFHCSLTLLHRSHGRRVDAFSRFNGKNLCSQWSPFFSFPGFAVLIEDHWSAKSLKAGMRAFRFCQRLWHQMRSNRTPSDEKSASDLGLNLQTRSAREGWLGEACIILLSPYPKKNIRWLRGGDPRENAEISSIILYHHPCTNGSQFSWKSSSSPQNSFCFLTIMLFRMGSQSLLGALTSWTINSYKIP